MGGAAKRTHDIVGPVDAPRRIERMSRTVVCGEARVVFERAVSEHLMVCADIAIRAIRALQVEVHAAARRSAENQSYHVAGST